MLRTLLLFTLLLNTLYALPTLKTMKKEHRVAIVIGNSDYDDHPLPQAKKNARLMKKFLEKNGFYVYYGENLDKKNFVRLLRKFVKNLHPNGVGLVYYSGHTVQTKGKNYLIPLDHGILNESMIVRKSMSLNAIYSSMEESYDRLNIVILDTAFQAPFGTIFTPKKSGLASIHSPKAQVTFSATQPDSENRSDTFTKDFLHLASQKGLELTQLKNALITLRRQHGQERPSITIARNQPFYFHLPEHIPAADELAYSKIKEDPSKRDLTKFINRYPSSPYTKKAKRALETLRIKEQRARQQADRARFEQEAALATRRAKKEAAAEAKKKNEITFKLTKPEDVKKRETKKPKKGEERQIILE